MEGMAGPLFGVLLGMRHACEPDHLAAISTMVGRGEGGRARPGMLLGLLWGFGHTAALLAVAAALTALQARLPARLADAFELGVAAMLLALGARALRQAAATGDEGPRKLHAHGAAVHAHGADNGHVHLGRWTLAVRPLAVGMVHGLAGSGALTALVFASLPGTRARLVYVALFGLGSAAGMALLSGVAGWPLARLGRRPAAARALALATGLFSVGFGLFWGWSSFWRCVGSAS